MAGLIRLGAFRAVGGSCSSVKTSFRRNINISSKRTSGTTSEASQSENKNWISFGFSDVDPVLDRLSMHITSFMSISLVMVLGGFYFAFLPDPKLHEWSQREAYLELRRRESLGLPPIDADYVHPSKVQLPTDEELGATPIII